MAEILELDLITRLDIPTERVLRGATNIDLEKVVVMGYEADGTIYFASSMADGGDVLWLLEKCKKLLLEY